MGFLSVEMLIPSKYRLYQDTWVSQDATGKQLCPQPFQWELEYILALLLHSNLCKSNHVIPHINNKYKLAIWNQMCPTVNLVFLIELNGL